MNSKRNNFITINIFTYIIYNTFIYYNTHWLTWDVMQLKKLAKISKLNQTKPIQIKQNKHTSYKVRTFRVLPRLVSTLPSDIPSIEN